MKPSAASESWKLRWGSVDHERLRSDEKLQAQITPSGGIF